MAFSMFLDGGGFLGVHVEDINKENMARYGMRDVRGVGITEVVKDSPAEKAGLRKDDVIVRFENENITSTRKLTRLVSEVAPDHTVRLTVSRGGSEQDVSVTVGKRENTFSFNRIEGLEALKDMDVFKGKQLEALKRLDKLKEFHKMTPDGKVWKWEGSGPDGYVWAFGNSRRIGVSTTELTKQLAEYFGIADGQGVLITSVADDSPAAKAGLKAGDIVTAIDGEKVDSSGDLSRAINKKKDGDVTLTVIRKGNQRNVTVTPKEGGPMVVPGAPRGAGGGARIVIPRVDLGVSPTSIVLPEINIPVIPRIEVQIPDKMIKPRVIRTGGNHPI